MAYILARRHLSTLARFASSNVMIGFDYDGTLAPIVSVPARACMRGKTRRLLRAVAQRLKNQAEIDRLLQMLLTLRPLRWQARD